MKVRRSIVIGITACLLAVHGYAGAGGVFEIATKPSLKFAEGGNVYKMGQAMADFLSSFGPAEIIKEDTYAGFNAQHFTKDEYSRQYLAYTKSHYYVNDGVIITEDKEGRIRSIIFYVMGDNTLKNANVKTQEGITRGASLREIVKTYGEPFKKKEKISILGYQDTQIYYRYGDDVLSFRFRDGVLETINMHAGYLPYLK